MFVACSFNLLSKIATFINSNDAPNELSHSVIVILIFFFSFHSLQSLNFESLRIYVCHWKPVELIERLNWSEWHLKWAPISIDVLRIFCSFYPFVIHKHFYNRDKHMRAVQLIFIQINVCLFNHNKNNQSNAHFNFNDIWPSIYVSSIRMLLIVYLKEKERKPPKKLSTGLGFIYACPKSPLQIYWMNSFND